MWLVDYHLAERDRVFIEEFTDPVLFARKRRDVVASLVEQGVVQNPIYATSHCNLFANIGGKDEKQNEELLRINEEFYSNISEIALQPRGKGKHRVLLQYADNEKETLTKELARRLEIFAASERKLKAGWGMAEFQVRHLLAKSVKDYLIIEDHVFKTIRKTTSANEETTYVYLRSEKLARIYRAWLEDLFEYGEKDGYAASREIDAVFQKLRNEARGAVPMRPSQH